MNLRTLLAFVPLALVACAAPPADDSSASTSAVEASPPKPGAPVMIGEGFDGVPVALSALGTAHVAVWLDVPGLYMCGAKITFAADAPAGIESALVLDVPPNTFGVAYDVRRTSAREIQLHTLGSTGWSGILYFTTADGRTIADTFAGVDGTIEQLYCRDTNAR
jgi:hypothetical protein